VRGHSTNPAAIEAEIAHLRSLALDALRRHWRVIFGQTPPADLSKDLLGRMIAYRLQERAFGGLDRESLRFLDGLARHGGPPRRRLKPGIEGQGGASCIHKRRHWLDYDPVALAVLVIEIGMIE
jgi:hypothetical protein